MDITSNQISEFSVIAYHASFFLFIELLTCFQTTQVCLCCCCCCCCFNRHFCCRHYLHRKRSRRRAARAQLSLLMSSMPSAQRDMEGSNRETERWLGRSGVIGFGLLPLSARSRVDPCGRQLRLRLFAYSFPSSCFSLARLGLNYFQFQVQGALVSLLIFLYPS